MSDLPDELGDLDKSLRSIRFEPRASLGPELARRARDGDPGGRGGGLGPRDRRGLAAAALLVLGAALAILPATSPWRNPELVTVDRCCYDLDGGGEADDGVLIEAERDDRVHRLKVYEDADRSGSFTAADVLRLDRGRELALLQPAAGDLVTIERCCLDFDGGGPDDDGLIVIGVPPDRVVMAAIYERGDGRRQARAALLR